MQYKFSCDAGYVGKIKLFVSEAKIPVPTDTILQYLEFSNICKGLSEIRTTNVNGNLHFSLPKEKILFVYPIVATEQLFIVSPTLLVNSFSGFTGASYSFSNGAVRIKGVLNPYANKIKAVVSNEKYVETPKGGEEYSFTAESFRKDGFIEIKLKPNNVYYITLFPGFSRNGVESFSRGTRCRG